MTYSIYMVYVDIDIDRVTHLWCEHMYTYWASNQTAVVWESNNDREKETKPMKDNQWKEKQSLWTMLMCICTHLCAYVQNTHWSISWRNLFWSVTWYRNSCLGPLSPAWGCQWPGLLWRVTAFLNQDARSSWNLWFGWSQPLSFLLSLVYGWD